MFRLFLYMAVLGALLKVAKSDFKCFADKLKNLDENLQLFFGENKGKDCESGIKELIDSLQHAIDECSVPVTTDSMKSLLEEACQPDSELHQTFEESWTCLQLNRGLGAVCKQRVHTLDPSLSIKEECLKMKHDFLTCTAETVGGPCGEKAMNVLKRVYKTSDSLTHGVCEEAASAGSWSLFYRYLHWIAIAVVGLIAVIVMVVRSNKLSAPKGFDRKILINETV